MVSEEKEISDLAIKISNINAVDVARISSDFSTKYTAANSEVEDSKNNLNKLLKDVAKCLKDKSETINSKEDFIKRINFSEFSNLYEKYMNAIASINEIISEHNEIIKNFDENKSKKENELKIHYVSSALTKFNELTTAQDIKKEDFSQKAENYKTAKQNLEEVKKQQTNTSDAAEQINELLKLMGHPHLELEATDDGYNLMRSGYLVKDGLSEGERTAITFAHFIASLNDQDFNIEESIVVIDDPISSLDQNVLYAVFGVIKAYAQNANQIFLMTHHHGFFVLLLSWIRHVKKSERGMYRVIRTFHETTGEAISNIHNELEFIEKYNSEYHYLFFTLNEFRNEIETREVSLEEAQPYFNIARKLLETFLKFKYPDNHNISACFGEMEKEFIGEPNKIALCRDVRAVIMDASHADIESITQLAKSLTPENVNVIISVFELVSLLDKEHYDRLISFCESNKRKIPTK